MDVSAIIFEEVITIGSVVDFEVTRRVAFTVAGDEASVSGFKVVFSMCGVYASVLICDVISTASVLDSEDFILSGVEILVVDIEVVCPVSAVNTSVVISSVDVSEEVVLNSFVVDSDLIS